MRFEPNLPRIHQTVHFRKNMQRTPKNELGALGKWVSMIVYLGDTGRIVKPSQRIELGTEGSSLPE